MMFPQWTGGCRGLAAEGAAGVDVGGRDRSGKGEQPDLAEQGGGRRGGPAAVAAGAAPGVGAAAPAGRRPRRVRRPGVRHRGHRWSAPGLDARAQLTLSRIGAAVRAVGDHRRPRAAGVAAVRDRSPGLRGADLPGPPGPGPAGVRPVPGRADRRGAPPPRPDLRAQGRPAAACTINCTRCAQGWPPPDGHGRALKVDSVIGQAVLDCAAAFAGRPPALRSLRARAHGPVLLGEAEFWIDRWRACLWPPTDAAARATRLGRSMARWRALTADTAAVDGEIATLLAGSDGQVLTTLPGVATSRAAAFAAFSLPIARFPTAEHLYSATGLAPGGYQSSTINRRTPISRQGLPEHRDALMNLAWGLSQHCGPFVDRHRELRERGLLPIPARIALARHACRLAYTLIKTQQPFDEQRYRRARHQSER